MHTHYFIIFLTLLSSTLTAEITGVVTNQNGEQLPFVNVYIENSNRGTTTNGDGVYELLLEREDQGKEMVVVFQFLGFETITRTVEIGSPQVVLDIVMTEATTSLDEVIVEAGVNPADRIIRATIANRKKNLDVIGEYTAKFYSRGLWQVQDAPDKILGQEVGDLGGGLDSTRTGIIYLSETISDISVQITLVRLLWQVR